MGSVIQFERPKLSKQQPIDQRLDQFNETRCRMLEAFAALAEDGASRADLTSEMLSTTGAMRGLRDCLCKEEDAANAG